MDTPTRSSRFDVDILSTPVMATQIPDSESLIDLDDGTTNSYHTAKDSRFDNGRQSTLSIDSNETTSTLHQTTTVQNEQQTNITSPEDGFYYDALASPLQANQQIASAIDKQNVLIDNLANLFEQIENFNRVNMSTSMNIPQHTSRLSPEGKESNSDIDQLTIIVSEIHQSNQMNTRNPMDNLLFIYDEIDDDQPAATFEENLVEDDQSTACVNNLVFNYDDTITPTEFESKPVGNLSTEWSYDNLTTEQIDTDHLATIMHEALAAKYPEPVEFQDMTEVKEDEEYPTATVHEQEEESSVRTDNLGTIVHEALAARFQKRIHLKQVDEMKTEIPTESVEQTLKDDQEESVVDTDHLGAIVHEALAARFQKPIKFKEEHSTVTVHEQQQEEAPVSTDNLGMIVHEALTARFQKPIRFKQTTEVMKEEDPTTIDKDDEESVVRTDYLGTIVHEAITAKLHKPTDMSTADPLVVEEHQEEFLESIDEPTDETSHLETIIHQVLTTNFQKPVKSDQWMPYVYKEEYLEPIDESISDTSNLGTIMHEALAARSEKPVAMKSTVTFAEDLVSSQSPELIDQIAEEHVTKPNEEIVPSTLEQPIDESLDNTYRSETITYEIESLIPPVELPVTQLEPPLPVSNLSRIVSDSLLASSNYHRPSRDENRVESTVTTHQPPIYDEEIYEEYGYRRTTTDPESEDIVEKYEELCHRYNSTFDQYAKTAKKFDDEINDLEKQFREKPKEQPLTPNSDTISEELVTTIERLVDRTHERENETTEETYVTVVVQRQPNHIGKYGFDMDESSDGKIQISSILDEKYCPNLHHGDEIISINNNRTFKTPEQCQLIFDSLWKNFYEDVQITIVQSPNIPNLPSK